MNPSSKKEALNQSPRPVTASIRQWADSMPAKTAFRFTMEDGSVDVITYGELNRWAHAIGSELKREYAPGTRAVLLFSPGLEFVAAFIGCLYSGIVAVPVCPPRPNRPSPQLTGILRNCEPRLVLATADYLHKRERLFRQIPDVLSLNWKQVDVLRSATAVDVSADCTESALALLQYTSGSTGSPKGVMVTHANLACNSALIREAFGSGPETRGVFWLPHYHDMGLIGTVIGTLYCGGTSVLMSPLSLIRRPMSWLEAITETRATITGGPDFSYALCADKIAPSQRQRLDLGSLEVAFSGAEPVRQETLDRFSAAFASCGFRREVFTPCYGMAEATLLVSSRLPAMALKSADVDTAALERNIVAPPVRDGAVRRVVSCGRALPQQDVRIVDPATGRDCAEANVGEIWVRGASIASGYWNNPEATRATFVERAEGSDACATFLRTGDLGFVREGELYVTGRLKDLIIVRGRNLYPHDVEDTARRSCVELNAATIAAFALEVNGQEELVLVAEIERRTLDERHAAIVQAVRQSVGSEHEVAVHAVLLVRSGKIPRTSSGKLRRRNCRELYLTGALETLHAWVGDGDAGAATGVDATVAGETCMEGMPGEAEIVSWLTTRIAALVGVPAGDVNTTTPFASFGLSSLQGVLLAEQLQTFVGQEIPATWIYNYPTIAELAHRIAARETAPPATAAVPVKDDELRREIGELSLAQLEALISGSMAEQSPERS